MDSRNRRRASSSGASDDDRTARQPRGLRWKHVLWVLISCCSIIVVAAVYLFLRRRKAPVSTSQKTEGKEEMKASMQQDNKILSSHPITTRQTETAGALGEKSSHAGDKLSDRFVSILRNQVNLRKESN
mmetsp:Transcript_13219/g.46290  ORF Transcript_13219/g.46290 Transcript_13219/m.46290 type:complete len:129 (-) Transcript_13219:2-388(-)